MKKSKLNNPKKHYFFLNPYKDCAFTKCPKCNDKTKVRKFPLVIHIEPKQLFIMNKSCKYCEKCDLIIGKQAEIENLMASCCEKFDPDTIGNKYLVFGTFDKSDWREYSQKTNYPQEVFDKVHIFKDVKHFEVVQGGWAKDG